MRGTAGPIEELAVFERIATGLVCLVTRVCCSA